MIDFPKLADIVQTTPSKIIMLVVDGLGGAPDPQTGHSELEVANTPYLDDLARESSGGMTIPILPGIAPGSGPGHLALFGYDPLKYFIGRGVLEALGVDASIAYGDVAARGNFCTIDDKGLLTDRRAGRIASQESRPLCDLLNTIQIPGVELSVLPVQDYRFVLLMRGDGLSDRLSETDPQRNNADPLPVLPLVEEANKTARAVNKFVSQARDMLGNRDVANMLLLRGFSQLPSFPSLGSAYMLNPAAIAAYPMYRGLAHVVGMKVISTGITFDEELDTLAQHYGQHDFFYLHYKPADAAGEDGNFEAKVTALEELDLRIPRLMALNPDVLIVAGDHATPAIMAAHSWHPVPLLLHSKLTKGDGVKSFSERACTAGSLGIFPATNLMLLALAHAGKLIKYGP
ncbi:2,3-bisphosphoglycerate-independent phosphoglycerate mutase [Dehalococcoidia bacterium]|nr:2,3-bisphosphoglycerate-independent phosphoglycerate mutase [Dehalococcoidia bacterium]